jgi:hypothetical protein
VFSDDIAKLNESHGLVTTVPAQHRHTRKFETLF